MSWTYSGNPSASPLDEVRFLIGDTNSAAPELQNEEINYTLTLVNGQSPPPPSGNFLPAAYCCDALIAKYKFLVDKSVGDLRISYHSLLANFQALSVKMRSRAALAGVPTYFGGLSLADKLAAYSNPDLITTAVRTDGMSSPDSTNNANNNETDSSQTP